MGPQILWARLEVLGPDDDVQEKEKRRRERKIRVPSLPSVLSYISPRSRYPILVP